MDPLDYYRFWVLAVVGSRVLGDSGEFMEWDFEGFGGDACAGCGGDPNPPDR